MAVFDGRDVRGSDNSAVDGASNTDKLRIDTFENQTQELQAVNPVEPDLSKPETGF